MIICSLCMKFWYKNSALAVILQNLYVKDIDEYSQYKYLQNQKNRIL